MQKQYSRCSHDPRNPILRVPLVRKRGQKVIFQKFCEKILKFYAKPSILTCLRRRAKPTKNPAHQIKSQRREAIVRVLSVLVPHVELATMRIGRPTSAGFIPLGLNFLIPLSGLSGSRFIRALADLKASGIVQTFRRYDKNMPGGAYRGLPAVRTVSPALFAALGMGKYLARMRDLASIALRDRATTESIAQVANLTMLASAQLSHSRKQRRAAVKQHKKLPEPAPGSGSAALRTMKGILTG